MDKSHFNTFIFSSADKIYYYVYCVLKNPEATIEVVTQTIEQCWEERKNFSHTEMTHVFKIARKLAKHRIVINDESSPFIHNEKAIFDTNPVLSRFCTLTHELSPIQAEVMCLRSMIRLSIDEISLVVELGINNVQSILSNVRKAIRAQIDPVGILKGKNGNEVLTKYYNGKTTIEEEEQLRLYFSRMDLNKIPDSDRDMFQLFLKLGNAEMPSACAEALMVKIKEIQNNGWRSSVANFFKK